jgi:hypothetical protein
LSQQVCTKESNVTENTPQDWIAQIEEFLQSTREAREFVERAAETFPRATPDHDMAVALLWQHAYAMDQQIYGLLEEMSSRLTGGQGVVDLTRGASVRPLMPGVVKEELLFYECTWSLTWEGTNPQITVKLSVEPQMESFHLQVGGFNTFRPSDLRFPMDEQQLKDALRKAYVREMLLP